MTPRNELGASGTATSIQLVRAAADISSAPEPHASDDRTTWAYWQTLRTALDRWETEGGASREILPRVS